MNDEVFMPENKKVWEHPHLQDFISESIRIGKIGQATKKLEEELQVCLNAGSPSSGLSLLVELSDLIEEVSQIDRKAYEELNELKLKLEIESKEFAAGFEREFPALAESAGIVFCQGTVHPTYYIDRSFIELKANIRNMSCVLKTRGGKEFKLGIEPKVVLNEINFHLRRLHSRELAPSELRDRVLKIYSELTSQDSTLNGSVRIKDFVKFYQKAYKTPLDETLIDLSNANREIPELKFDYIRDHQEGFQLYGLEENGYFGFLRIERT